MQLHPYCLKKKRETQTNTLVPRASATPKTTQYDLNQIKSIYKFPAPSSAPIVVGVISFGGGLIGSLTGGGASSLIAGIPTTIMGTLTSGDIITHWNSLGIKNKPRVIVVSVNRAPTRADPNDIATIENIMDVTIIGALCPTSSLTIILYIANPTDNFPQILPVMMNPINVNGTSYTPSIISCSWGAPEIYYSQAELNRINAMFQTAASRGITITAATGDEGSSDGTHMTTTDFPSSSPYVVACGGTTLFCNNAIYDKNTIEVAWSRGGGGISRQFTKPLYQSKLPGFNRLTPDIVLVADPNTGIIITVGGMQEVVGGTSVVAPAIAAFAATVNMKTPLAPILYTYPSSCFNDITIGSNGAYAAIKGYDNCTGLGSIIASLMVTPIVTPVRVTGISLSGNSALTVGNTIQLTASLTPMNAANQLIEFSTNNRNIALVSTSGIVMATAPGSVTITARSADGGYSAQIVITITSIPVTGVILSGTTTVNAGKTIQLTPIISPPNASNKNVMFTSSNPAVASVSASGQVMGDASGSAIITVTSFDGGFTSNVTMTVVAIPVVGIRILAPPSLIVDRTAQIIPTIMPFNASNQTVIYSSSNTSVATVSPAGVVTAISAGSVTFVATTVDGGFTATTNMIITTIPVTGVSFTGPSSVIVGQTAQLLTNIFPNNAINKAVRYNSSNPSILSVSASGIIAGLLVGNADITVTTADGGFTSTKTMTVTNIRVSSISLSTTRLQLRVGGTAIIIPTIQPHNAFNKLLRWSSTKPAVATVSNGAIVGRSKGTTRIVAITDDRNISATCNVTVS